MTSKAQHRPVRWKRRLTVLLSVLLTYGLCEVTATTLYLWGALDPIAYTIHEATDSEGNLRADTATGCRVSPVSSRLVVVSSDGKLSSEGRLRGNNFGFPDQDDFATGPSPCGEIRLGVLGDSYSAAYFLQMNWADRVERMLAGETGPRLRLYNLSMDGGGLGNWWGVLSRVVGPEGIGLDGLVFATAVDDLDRTFFWRDDSHRAACDPHVPIVLGNYLGRWGLPEQIEVPEVDCATGDHYWFVLPPEEFSHALENEDWPVHWRRPFALYFGSRAGRFLSDLNLLGIPDAQASGSGHREEAQRAMLSAMADWIAERELPVLIVDVGHNEDSSLTLPEFAAALGAETLPLAGDIEGCDVTDERMRIRHDTHWSQLGSDCFAKKVAEPLHAWALSLREKDRPRSPVIR